MIDESDKNHETERGELNGMIQPLIINANESRSVATKDQSQAIETTQEYTADPTFREIIEDSKSDMEQRRQAID